MEEEVLSDAVLRETEDAGEEYLAETLFLGDSQHGAAEGFGEIEMNSMAAVVGMGVQSVPTSSCIWFCRICAAGDDGPCSSAAAAQTDDHDVRHQQHRHDYRGIYRGL